MRNVYLVIGLGLALASCNRTPMVADVVKPTVSFKSTESTNDQDQKTQTLTIQATDDRALKEVKVYEPGQTVPVVLTAPFTYTKTFSNQDSGVNLFKVVATDTSGNITTKDQSVEVRLPVTITFWSWYLSPNYDDYVQGIINDFQTRYPYVTVNWEDKAGTLPDDLLNAPAGFVPDVVNLNTTETLAKAGSGLLKPITDFHTETELIQQYYPNALDNFSSGGKRYGYPWYGWFDDAVIIYNKTLFNQAGFVLPDDQPFKTNAQLISASKTLKDATGVYGFAPAINDPYNVSFLRIFQKEGLPIIDDKGRAVFANPENIDKSADLVWTYALLYPKFGLQRNLLLGYMPQEVLDQEAYQLSINLYKQGKLAMVIGGPQGLNQIKAYSPTLYANTGVLRAPTGAANLSLGGGMDLVIPAKSQNPKVGALFAKFATNNLNQMKLAKRTAIVPTTKLAATDPYFKEPDYGDPIRKASNLIGPRGADITTGLRMPLSQYSASRFSNFNKIINEIFAKSSEPKAALQRAQEYWNGFPDVQ